MHPLRRTKNSRWPVIVTTRSQYILQYNTVIPWRKNSQYGISNGNNVALGRSSLDVISSQSQGHFVTIRTTVVGMKKKTNLSLGHIRYQAPFFTGTKILVDPKVNNGTTQLWSPFAVRDTDFFPIFYLPPPLKFDCWSCALLFLCLQMYVYIFGSPPKMT